MPSQQLTPTTATATAATWEFDPDHSFAEFAVRHMMITTVRGKMQVRRGSVAYDPADPGAARIEAELDAASIHTGVGMRDDHLRSPDFLDAQTHPTLRFVGTRLTPRGDDEFELEGELTIRGVTQPVVLHVEKDGEGRGLGGDWRAGLTARATLDRTAWGLTWNQALETGGMLVGEQVKVTLHLQLVRRG